MVESRPGVVPLAVLFTMSACTGVDSVVSAYEWLENRQPILHRSVSQHCILQSSPTYITKMLC